MAMARWLGSVWQWLGLTRSLLSGSPKGNQDLQPWLGIGESWQGKLGESNSCLILLIFTADRCDQ